jgi:hypothetical protein
MSSERSNRSHAAWWVILVAIPILYLLSVPWVLVLTHGTGTSPRGGPTQRHETPGWAETYSRRPRL